MLLIKGNRNTELQENDAGARRRIVQIVRATDKALHALRVHEGDNIYYLEAGVLVLAEIRGPDLSKARTAPQ